MPEHYPSTAELFARSAVPLPDALKDRIAERYLGGRDQYASDQYAEDGRIVNRCMLTDSLGNVEEEVVDAVFNLLVAMLKAQSGALNGKSEIYVALTYAVDLWRYVQRIR